MGYRKNRLPEKKEWVVLFKKRGSKKWESSHYRHSKEDAEQGVRDNNKMYPDGEWVAKIKKLTPVQIKTKRW